MAGMSKVSRMKRLEDLFVEGQELVLSPDDGDGKPIIVWVSKPSIFEEEECRRDGIIARTARIVEVERVGEEHPDIAESVIKIRKNGREAALEMFVSQGYSEDFVGAVSEADGDEDWRKKLDYIRYGNDRMDEDGVPEDDQKRKDWEDTAKKYFEAVDLELKTRQERRRVDGDALEETELVKQAIEKVRDMAGMAEFIRARRLSQIYYATKDCQATNLLPSGKYDHSKCVHDRLLIDKSVVLTLPGPVAEKITEVLDLLEVPQVVAGNSDAPTGSSAPSEQPNDAAGLELSTPEETSLDAPKE